MERKITKGKYILAGIMTLVIFVTGMLLGFVVESKRVNYVDQMTKEHELNYNSIQLQYVYIDQLGSEGNCPAVQKTLEKNIEDLSQTAARLEDYDKSSQLNKEDFTYLRHQYLLSEIRYWLFVKKTKEICGGDYQTVLYFYSTETECPRCQDQAFILTYLKKIFKDDLLNFAIDGRFEEEPLVQILKSTYDIKEYPTLVVGNKVFSGFAKENDILKELCDNFSNSTRALYKESCALS